MSLSNYKSVLLVYFLSLNNPQNAQIMPPYDKICAFGSAIDKIDGTYKNPVWNPELNGSTYYNEKTSQYLYPYIVSDRYRYFMIGPHPTFTSITSLTAYCVIQTNDNTFDIADCFKDWKYLLNDEETNDINMRIVNCNDIRVTNSNSATLNGIYLWLEFVDNYSVYYCQDCDIAGTYIYGWIFSTGNYNWRLGADYKNNSASCSCPLGFNLGADYLFNLQDCEQWYLYNGTTNEWDVDGGMEVKERVPCDSNHEYCMYVDIYPSAILPTSNVVSIQNIDDDTVTYFHIFFTPHGMDCVHPTIAFKFEAIDYDSPAEYIRIINDNGTSIAHCRADAVSCGGFTQCFADIGIGVDKIEMNKTHQISIIESPYVDALCTSHDYSINAQLIFTCSVPMATNNPTRNPTTYPTLSPTRFSLTNATLAQKIDPNKPTTTILIVIVVVSVIMVALCIVCVVVVKWRESKEENIDVKESDTNSNPITETEIQRMITPDGPDYVREGVANKTIGETNYL